MDKRTGKKREIRPRKIHRSDESFWIPNPCINEHYLTQKLGELEKHETMYHTEHKKKQKEIQKELNKIRTSTNTLTNGHGFSKRKGRTRRGSKSHDMSITEMIDKFKMKRGESNILNELVKQQRSQYQDKDGSTTELVEAIFLSQADDIQNDSIRENKETNVLDEMKNSIDTARRVSSEMTWDELFDTVLKERKRSDPSLGTSMGHHGCYGNKNRHQRRHTLHGNEIKKNTKRIGQLSRAADPETSVTQLTFKRRTPSYVEPTPFRLTKQSHKPKPVDAKGGKMYMGLIRERTFYPEDIDTKRSNKGKSGRAIVKENSNSKVSKTCKTRRKSKTSESIDASKETENISNERENNSVKSKYLKKKPKTSKTLDDRRQSETKTAAIDDDTAITLENVINAINEIADTSREKHKELEAPDLIDGSRTDEIQTGERTDDMQTDERVIEFGGLIRESEELIILLPEQHLDNYEQKFEENLNRIKENENKSADAENDIDDKRDNSFVECEVQSPTSWDDVKRCRYLRGYDPPEMIMPEGELNRFVFGRDENDILDLKRQNKIDKEEEDFTTEPDTCFNVLDTENENKKVDP